MNELCWLFRVKKVTIRRWNNPKSPQYKPHFPIPLKISQVTLWEKAEIDAFIAMEKQRSKEKAEQLQQQKAEFKRHTQNVKEALFIKQKLLKMQTYTRPEKGERLSAHTLRKVQAFRLNEERGQNGYFN